MKRPPKDLIVVHIDGGICSQINFISYGLALSHMRGDKVKVKYDTSWFREDGKDCNGRFVRNWDFPKAFPGLPIEEATDAEIASVKKHHFVDLSEISSLDEISAPDREVQPRPRCTLRLHGRRDRPRSRLRRTCEAR